MAEIKEKMDSILKPVESLCETMEHAIKAQFDKGIDQVDTHEMYKAIDIYKDLSEVKKNIIEGCYKLQIMQAMEDADYYDDDKRYYRGQPRSKTTGRYIKRGYHDEMYPDEWYRDMDKQYGRMYYDDKTGYSDGYNKGYEDGTMVNRRDYREGHSGRSRRSYMESKAVHDNSTEGKQAKMAELEKYMNELGADITEMIAGASNEERTMLKSKMQTLMQKLQ